MFKVDVVVNTNSIMEKIKEAARRELLNRADGLIIPGSEKFEELPNGDIRLTGTPIKD